jgi:hypothetical protein
VALGTPGEQLAVLAVRTPAPPASAELQRLLSALRACGQSVAGFFGGQQSGTQRAGVPATAH